MILILSSPEDPMGSAVADELTSRQHQYAFISPHDIPRTVKLHLTPTETESAFIFEDGTRLAFMNISAIFHRIGFSNFEVFEEYSEEEVKFVNNECQMALAPWLNNFPREVINRPWASASNASKPYQADLIRSYGFNVPETIVTNLPTTVEEFYEKHEGKVIYKSISYHRSIVQAMTDEDLERLDSLQICPVQLQSYVDGVDVRVHVISSHAVFASLIESSGSDYRYADDKTMVPYELSADLMEACIDITQGLGLTLSGIDLRITPEGEVYCFEINPAPAFRWYEDHTGQPITASLVDYLIEISQNS